MRTTLDSFLPSFKVNESNGFAPATDGCWLWSSSLWIRIPKSPFPLFHDCSISYRTQGRFAVSAPIRTMVQVRPCNWSSIQRLIAASPPRFTFSHLLSVAGGLPSTTPILRILEARQLSR